MDPLCDALSKCAFHKNKVYTIGEDGQVQFKDSPSKSTYYIDDAKVCHVTLHPLAIPCHDV